MAVSKRKMTHKNSTVAPHIRVGRADRVADALKAAQSISASAPHTLTDWLISWSERQNDPEIIWHLDPIALRSAVTQAQQRLHVALHAYTTKTPKGEMSYNPRAAGDYNHLLGVKLFPSAPISGKKRGPANTNWCSGIATLPPKKEIPSGMKIPEIAALAALAAVVDPDFGSDGLLVALVHEPQKKRSLSPSRIIGNSSKSERI